MTPETPCQPLAERPGGTVSSALKEADKLIFFISGPDIVQTSPIAQVQFPGLYGEQFANLCSPCKRNGHVQGNGNPAVGVTCKSKGGI